MDKLSLPVACSLTEAELLARRSLVLEKAKAAVLEVKELADGYGYLFPSDDLWLKELFNIVSLERQCCPFLNFKLIIEAGHRPVWLEITGPDGTKDFLKDLFG
ncbi:MAG: hypothetical protein WCB68_03040 [Pyrinomonadaceae bacterium]